MANVHARMCGNSQGNARIIKHIGIVPSIQVLCTSIFPQIPLCVHYLDRGARRAGGHRDPAAGARGRLSKDVAARG